MFLKYAKLIGKLFTDTWQTHETVDVSLWLQTLGYSLMLALSVALLIALILFVIGGPYKINQWLIGKPKAILVEELTKREADQNKIAQYRKSIKVRQWIYWLLFGFIYIPVAIPTALFLLSVITGGSL